MCAGGGGGPPPGSAPPRVGGGPPGGGPPPRPGGGGAPPPRPGGGGAPPPRPGGGGAPPPRPGGGAPSPAVPRSQPGPSPSRPPAGPPPGGMYGGGGGGGGGYGGGGGAEEEEYYFNDTSSFPSAPAFQSVKKVYKRPTGAGTIFKKRATGGGGGGGGAYSKRYSPLSVLLFLLFTNAFLCSQAHLGCRCLRSARIQLRSLPLEVLLVLALADLLPDLEVVPLPLEEAPLRRVPEVGPLHALEEAPLEVRHPQDLEADLLVVVALLLAPEELPAPPLLLTLRQDQLEPPQAHHLVREADRPVVRPQRRVVVVPHEAARRHALEVALLAAPPHHDLVEVLLVALHHLALAELLPDHPLVLAAVLLLAQVVALLPLADERNNCGRDLSSTGSDGVIRGCSNKRLRADAGRCIMLGIIYMTEE